MQFDPFSFAIGLGAGLVLSYALGDSGPLRASGRTANPLMRKRGQSAVAPDPLGVLEPEVYGPTEPLPVHEPDRFVGSVRVPGVFIGHLRKLAEGGVNIVVERTRDAIEYVIEEATNRVPLLSIGSRRLKVDEQAMRDRLSRLDGLLRKFYQEHPWQPDPEVGSRGYYGY